MSTLPGSRIRLCREIASEGFVLLENDNALLPLAPCRCAFFGPAQEKMQFYAGGAVSVRTAPYYIGAVSGLKQAGFIPDEELLARYNSAEEYEPTFEEISAAARRNDLAVVVIDRYTGEGEDHACYPGDFLLWEKEQQLLDHIEKANFQRTCFLINCGAMIDLKPFHDFKGPKALLLVWLPGMEGGNAIADVMTGAVTPSGKLPDTVACRCADYPGTDFFRRHPWRVDYCEDIYMGYRFFETLAPEKVLYPFGFGLSYTSFELLPAPLEYSEEVIKVSCRVTNSGPRPGKEVVQWYLTVRSESDLERPEKVLVSFAKTPLLQPGESTVVSGEIRWRDCAAFDDRPGSAWCGCWVLEQGEYIFGCGNSVRGLLPAGAVSRKESTILQKCGILLQETVARRLSQKGTALFHPDWETLGGSGQPVPDPCREKLPDLREVASGRMSMADFTASLTVEELIHLLHAHGSAFPHGTAGIGNLPHLGVPNIQTCDGSAGLHISTEATAYPCGVLLAASWNTELQERFGQALGEEAAAYGCDVILGPGVNLHRTPFCGRNAEYFSEDPLLSGRSGGAVIRGIQSTGIAANLKHFAANNRETSRRECDSVVPERALRELYLKSFEYAVREGDPLSVMASDGLITGRHATSNYHLLTTILKDEWQSRAVVLTDWRCLSSHLEEILAGCHLRMPLVPDDRQYRLVKEAFDMGLISRERLEKMAGEILSFVMQSRSFREGRQAERHLLRSGEVTRIDALAFSEVTATRTRVFPCSDPAGSRAGVCHGKLCKDYGGNDPRISFVIETEDVENTRKYEFKLRTALPGNKAKLLYTLDKKNWQEFALHATFSPEEITEDFFYDKWETQGTGTVTIAPGIHEFTIRITDPDNYGISINFLEFTPLN